MVIGVTMVKVLSESPVLSRLTIRSVIVSRSERLGVLEGGTARS